MSSLSDVRSMDPYDFEKLVARVWSSKGYETNVRKASNDKGVDIEANSGNHKILIQAKRYAANSKIGGPDVRNYATLYQQDPTADQVIIVTTSSFTQQAKEIAAEQNITIVNGSNFVDMMEKNSIQLDEPDQKVRSYTPSKNYKEKHKYFNKCPICGDQNVVAKESDRNVIIKCRDCKSKWEKMEVSNNIGGHYIAWKGISGEAQGVLKTTSEWVASTNNTGSQKNTSSSTKDHKSQQNKTSSAENQTKKASENPGFFAKLGGFFIVIFLLSIFHSLISLSVHEYQLWLIILILLSIFIGALNDFWKDRKQTEDKN